MILRDLRIKFKDTMPISDGFFKLMQKTFGFYTSICNEFFKNLGKNVESNNLGTYLQNEIRPKLFDPKHCKEIESIKKQFLSENIKLEQFVAENKFDDDFINDLSQLKKVSDALYELLQTHWEFYKYEKSVASNEAIIAFILEIDRIGIRWDVYLEKYLTVSGILKTIVGDKAKDDFSQVSVRYHLPEATSFTLEMCTNLVNFFQSSYEFVLKIHDLTENAPPLEINNLNVGNPIFIELLVPSTFEDSFNRFLGYLSVDVLKRETLVKFVMEIVRLQQGKEIPKTAITNFQKKIAKMLNQLPEGGYFSINEEDSEDSVKLLSSMCDELDRLKVEYKDLLTGSTNRLARNKQPLANLSPIAKKTGSVVAEKTDKTAADKKAVAETSPKKDTKKDQDESTVKINVKNKEHIQYLTS